MCSHLGGSLTCQPAQTPIAQPSILLDLLQLFHVQPELQMRKRRGAGDCQGAQPHRGEPLLAHPPLQVELQEGWKGTQFHETHLCRCDLNPKQLLSPSAVSLCHGRGHLLCLKSPYQTSQGTFTPLTSLWARSGGGGHQTITRVLPLGFQTLPKALRAYSQACCLSPVLQGQAPGSCTPSTPYPQWNIPAPPAPPIPWGKAAGCNLPTPPAPQSLETGSKFCVPAPSAPAFPGTGTQVPFLPTAGITL